MIRLWNVLRNNDELDRLKRENASLKEQLDELRLNIVPLPAPWRESEVFSQVTKGLLLQRITALNPPQQCRNINVLVIGNLGSGKSSLVNTFLTSLRNSGQIANIATTYQANIESTTCKLHEVILQNNPGTKQLRVYDCRGIGPTDGVREDDLIRVIEGNVKKNYEFDEFDDIDENDDYYRRNPTISDKMHCILFVAKADEIEEGVDFTVLKNIQRYLNSENIPLRLILTRIDNLDLCAAGDLSSLFVSRQAERKVNIAKAIFRLHDSQILPIANYVRGTTQNVNQDILTLQAVENILNEAVSYIENQI